MIRQNTRKEVIKLMEAEIEKSLRYTKEGQYLPVLNYHEGMIRAYENAIFLLKETTVK